VAFGRSWRDRRAGGGSFSSSHSLVQIKMKFQVTEIVHAGELLRPAIKVGKQLVRILRQSESQVEVTNRKSDSRRCSRNIRAPTAAL